MTPLEFAALKEYVKEEHGEMPYYTVHVPPIRNMESKNMAVIDWELEYFLHPKFYDTPRRDTKPNQMWRHRAPGKYYGT